MPDHSARAPVMVPVQIDAVHWEASLASGTGADRAQAEAWRAKLGDPPKISLDPVTLRRCRDDEDTGTMLAGCLKTYAPDPRIGSPPSRWRAVLLPAVNQQGELRLVFLAFGKGHPDSDLPTGQRRVHQRPSVYQLAHQARQRPA